MLRRADSDEDTLISAPRLMILKACAGDENIPACVNRQIAQCVRHLEALRRRMNEPKT